MPLHHRLNLESCSSSQPRVKNILSFVFCAARYNETHEQKQKGTTKFARKRGLSGKSPKNIDGDDDDNSKGNSQSSKVAVLQRSDFFDETIQSLNIDEIRTKLITAGRPLSEEQGEILLKHIDTDGDGQVSRQEFIDFAMEAGIDGQKMTTLRPPESPRLWMTLSPAMKRSGDSLLKGNSKIKHFRKYQQRIDLRQECQS